LIAKAKSQKPKANLRGVPEMCPGNDKKPEEIITRADRTSTQEGYNILARGQVTAAVSHNERVKPKETQHIGQRRPLIDGLQKATGEGIYCDDYNIPSTLYGRILRSTLPHALIKKIDFSKALALPGVRAVCKGDELPKKFGVLPISKDENAMGVDKVRLIGDCVAGVAADSEEIAMRAVELIEVEYERLPEYLDKEKALKPAEVQIHEHSKGGTNIHKAVDQEFGDVAGGFAASKYVRTMTCEFPAVTHAYTEPMAAIAHYDLDGRLKVISATQVPHYLHRALGEVMEMELDKIQVVKPLVGGGFGGKSDPFPHELIAALLSKKTRRPVKIIYDREECFISHHGRHPSTITMKLGVDGDGLIQAMDLNALIDGGAYGSFGVVTTYYNGVLTHGPYKLPAFKYSGRRVYTNKPPSGAMRGHGSVNTRFVMESLLDVVSSEAGFDPIEFRLKNCLPEDTRTINDFRITSNGIRECLERVRDRSGWNDKYRKLPYGKGIGIGCGFYISGSALPIHKSRLPQSTVHLKVDFDGGVTIHSLAADIGQGSDTMLAQVVAEVLGLPMNMMHVKASDTDMAPVDLGSYSSRVTFMAGNAAKMAAEKIAAQLAAAAEKLTGVPADRFRFRDGKLIDREKPETTVPYKDALAEALADSGALLAKGHYQSSAMGGTYKGAGAGLSPTYSYQAFAAQVDVDAETGFVRVEKVWAAHDVGYALNPLAVEGQIEGSIHMGLGQALMEQMEYRHGRLLNANLLDYRIPSPMEMPEIECILVETIDPEGPFGAKECGEGALAPVIPAVANAIYDAVGVRLNKLPMTPDKVLDAIERQTSAKGWKQDLGSVAKAG
jgi:4-hydroxybenzoyl-CoA reductase alpha subunit